MGVRRGGEGRGARHGLRPPRDKLWIRPCPHVGCHVSHLCLTLSFGVILMEALITTMLLSSYVSSRGHLQCVWHTRGREYCNRFLSRKRYEGIGPYVTMDHQSQVAGQSVLVSLTSRLQ